MDSQPSNSHILDAILSGEEVTETNGQTIRILPHLHDTRKPAYEVQKEQPWHRSLAYMLLQGVSTKDCAEQFNVSKAHIGQLRMQPWFKDVVVQLSSVHFDDNILGLLQSAAIESISVLADLQTNANSEAVRRASASDLLNQFLKAAPPKKAEPAADPSAELEQLQSEIERLKSQDPDELLD